MGTQPSKEIETFPNPEPGRNYEIQMTCPELTCLCPRTGQPDFATLTLTYVRGGIHTVITASYQPDEQA